MWARIFALTIKEFLTVMRDPKSRLMIILPPIIQLLIFSYAATFDLNNIAYAVYNEDPGFASRELLSHFDGTPTFYLKKNITNNAEIAPFINNRDGLLVIRIDQQFTRNLLAHRPGQVQVIVDGRNSNTATIALNYVNAIISNFSGEWAKKYHWQAPPAQLITQAWFNPNLLSQWFIVPGIVATLMLIITLIVTGLSVAREREQGTFDQLLVTPLNPFEILIGKSIPGVVIGFCEGLFIALVAVFWFHIPFTGNILTLAFAMLLYLLSAIGVGLMISSLAVTQQQGLLGVFLFLVPSVILSGFATPIANMPPIVQDLTLINPLRYFLIIVRGIFLQGDGFFNLLPVLWPLALIAFVSMSAAAWLFRHRV